MPKVWGRWTFDLRAFDVVAVLYGVVVLVASAAAAAAAGDAEAGKGRVFTKLGHESALQTHTHTRIVVFSPCFCRLAPGDASAGLIRMFLTIHLEQ